MLAPGAMHPPGQPLRARAQQRMSPADAKQPQPHPDSGEKRLRSPFTNAEERRGKRRTLSSDKSDRRGTYRGDALRELLGASPAGPPGRRSRTTLQRDGMNFDVAQMNMSLTPRGSEGDAADFFSSGDTYQSRLAESLFDDGHTRQSVASAGVLRYVESPPPPLEPRLEFPASLRVQAAEGRGKGRAVRMLPQMAERVLDAPNISSDPRMTLIDMSKALGILAVALGDTVYTWNQATNESGEFFSTGSDDNAVTSLAWQTDGSVCAAGVQQGGIIKLWDVRRMKQLRQMDGHSSAVCALAWNAHVVTSGGDDGLIVHHDVRVKKHKVAVLRGHGSDVCSLQYSPDFCTLASGGGDGTVMVWDAAPGVTAHKQRIAAHDGAVTGLGWAPFARHTLATGGGTDRLLKLWGTNGGSLLGSTPVGSDVSSLLWADNAQELLTAHGDPENHLALWKFQKPGRFAQLGAVRGHQMRVLNAAKAPDGQTVVTCSCDETIRFWKIFEEPKRRRAPMPVPGLR